MEFGDNDTIGIKTGSKYFRRWYVDELVMFREPGLHWMCSPQPTVEQGEGAQMVPHWGVLASILLSLHDILKGSQQGLEQLDRNGFGVNYEVYESREAASELCTSAGNPGSGLQV